jgi:hypothetical protein
MCAGDEAYATPAEAALAQWEEQPQADVRVVPVKYTDDDHAVVLDHDMASRRKPGDPMSERSDEIAERRVTRRGSQPSDPWTAVANR